MLTLPKSKRRRASEQQHQQQNQQEKEVASNVQAPQLPCSQQRLANHNKNQNDNTHNHNNNYTSSSSTSIINNHNRKTVTILDVPADRDKQLRSSISRDHNNSSFRSLSSIQSSNTYSSAQEYIKDSESNYYEADNDDGVIDDGNNNCIPVHLHHQRQQPNDGYVTVATTTTNTNNNTTYPEVTAFRKSSEGSGNTSSSNQSTSLPSNGVDRKNKVKANGTTTTIGNRSSTIKSDDDDDENHRSNETLTGWSLFVYTISNVPDDEYYTMNLKSSSSTTLFSYDVLQKLRITLGYAVSNSIVQTIIIFLIIINAILMGVATFDFVTENPEVLHKFVIVDSIFLILFTVELGLQLFYRGISLFYDGWLLFDFIIIVLSWSLQSIQIIRAFRIFRSLRLVSRLQVLRELITALGSVMPRMYAISMLLFLIFYIFAVLFTQLFGELELSGNYFTTLDASLFTCMNMMTLEWINVTREVMTHYSWAWAPISSFISITGFIVYNLVVAVVCDAVAVLDRTKQREALAAQKVIDDNVYAEAQRDQIQIAQQRMNELLIQIERMKQQHINMCHTVEMLSGELQQSMIVITNLRQDQTITFS